MTILLLVFAAAAMILPALARVVGRAVFPVAAIVPLLAFGHAVMALPGVLAGETVVESVPWIPQLGVSFTLVLDALSLVMALIVGGVGAIVLVYCSRYFRAGDAAIGRFVGVFTAFAGAMYGLVLADDLYLLFAFWEATSVLSYLLIGHAHTRRASRAGALQALLVTVLGGLVMFVGFVILDIVGGTSSIRELLAAPPSGTAVTVATMLVLVGALSKSANFPFHFWLPGAMAAPTPVSAYLHAAAMVKAGVYLVLRLSPGFAETPGWTPVLVTLGLITMILGGIQSLRQTDLKLVLAHGTVSQLGFLMAVAGLGTAEAVLAATLLLVAHALFKSALFLIAGIIDHRMGTRDLRRITGVGRQIPLLALAAALAVASMAGLPSLFGFVAKEAVFASLVSQIQAGDGSSWVVLGVIVLGAMITLAYGIRFLWGAFGNKDVPAELVAHGRRATTGEVVVLRTPVLILVALSLLLGPLAFLTDPLLRATVAWAPEGVAALPAVAFWHGFGWPLLATGISLLGGIVLAVLFARRSGEPGAALAERAYRGVLAATDGGAAWVISLFQRGSLPYYVGTIFLVMAVTLGGGLLLIRSWPEEWIPAHNIAQLGTGAVMVLAAIAATRATKRFHGAVLVGITGTGMAAIFATNGAPDLALTQILVEVVTLLAFALVLRRLPSRLGDRHGSAFRVPRAILAIVLGIVMALVALVAAGARSDQPISIDWPELAVTQGHGYNVVNVALVDIRAWDTMGELSVMIAAGIGVASLVFIISRRDDQPLMNRREVRRRARDRRSREDTPLYAPVPKATWLLAGRLIPPENRSIFLEVVVRLIFHFLIVVSVYLLLVGHNAPGGGFAAGLVVGLALAARYLAGGAEELRIAVPFNAGAVLGTGLLLATGMALAPLVVGADALSSTWFTIPLGPLGEVDFVTSAIFDVGVYFVVIGLILDVLRSLGSEVDRQAGEIVADPEEAVA